MMCEEKIFRCPVCDSVLEFSLDDDNTLRCECPDCGLTGCDARFSKPQSKAIAYISLCMDIPLEFFLNKIAKGLQETNEILSSSTNSIAESIKVLIENFQEIK